MNGIDELLQRNWTRIVFVEYLENSIGEKRLKMFWKKKKNKK